MWFKKLHACAIKMAFAIGLMWCAFVSLSVNIKAATRGHWRGFALI